MKKSDVANKLTRAASRTKLKIKKHSPEILVVAGVIGVVSSAVMACKATTKVGKIVEENEVQVDAVHEAVETGKTNAGETYTEEDSKKDLAIIYTQTGLKYVKLYGPSIALGVLSLTAIISSHNILRKRNVALAAAYTAVDKGFKEYRGRVVERFGKELDRELRYNIRSKEIEERVVDENGEERIEKHTVEVAGPPNESDYARFFDDGCTGWTKNAEFNLMFLRQQQAWANDKLKADGYLFLNDVYEMLGIQKTKAGQVVGWIYDEENPNGDNYVDFGIYNLHNRKAREFVNGVERVILLDFNVDGNIWELMQ